MNALCVPVNAAQGEVFIHIGIGKTGTTSIQEVLSRNRERLLAEGVLYPSAGVSAQWGSGHHNLFMLGGPANEPEFAALAAEIKASSPKKTVISSENLTYASPEVIRRVADFFGGKATIIFYVRRQTDLIESLFLQWQKTGRDYRGDIRSFFLQRKEKKGLDLMLRIRPWSEAFGVESILARVYDRRVIGGDVCEDFIRLVGIQASLDSVGFMNPSILPEFSPLIALIDRLPPPADLRASLISALLDASVKLKPCSTAKLVDAKLRKEIIAHYADSNLRFAQQYLPPDQWDFFLES